LTVWNASRAEGKRPAQALIEYAAALLPAQNA
jgi:hypothetical protein